MEVKVGSGSRLDELINLEQKVVRAPEILRQDLKRRLGSPDAVKIVGRRPLFVWQSFKPIKDGEILAVTDQARVHSLELLDESGKIKLSVKSMRVFFGDSFHPESEAEDAPISVVDPERKIRLVLGPRWDKTTKVEILTGEKGSEEWVTVSDSRKRDELYKETVGHIKGLWDTVK